MTAPADKRYSPEEAAALRAEVLAGVAKAVTRVFEAHPELRSALMFVSQFWDDEAHDAVHLDLLFSTLPTPDVGPAERAAETDDEVDAVNLPPGLCPHDLEFELLFGPRQRGPGGAKPPFAPEFVWDDNGQAISLFAAFTKEGADQTMPRTQAGSIYAHFARSSAGVDVEVRGQMHRPWLDGVMPSWAAPRG